MKKIAFLQAVILVVLLLVSWVLILLKFSSGNEPQPQETPKDEGVQDIVVEEDLAGEATSSIAGEAIGNAAPPPPQGWEEWIDYIRNQPNAALRRQAISDLRQRLFEIPVDEAITRLLGFLDSGFDFSTGLRFQTAKAGALAGASSFRAILLDWLGQLDPEAAAQFAYRELTAIGTGLHPDVYVIHMRNYAWGSPGDAISGFLHQQFNALLDNQAWIAKPTASIGEAMDIAVFLQDSNLVPALAVIAHPDQDRYLRHAANLALERLFEIDPLGAAEQMLQSETGMALDGQNKVSLLARLDPAGPNTRTLLEDYLLSSAVNASDFELYVQYLPNLNISYSYNLLSPEKPITQSAHHTDRLRNALDMIENWQEDPRFSRYRNIISNRIESMQVQLYGNPGP